MATTIGIGGAGSEVAPAAWPGRSARTAPARFDEALRGATASSKPTDREVAERFVSVALVEPVLAQLRETNGAAEPFAPSRHERHFSAMLDAAVSREIVGASGWGLVDRIETTLARRARATREAMGDV